MNFDPATGSDIQKRRPAVIVSNNQNNIYMHRVQVLPITSNVSRVYQCETLVMVGDKQGKSLADQITTVDKSRFGDFICTLTDIELSNISKIIKLQLDL